MTDFNKKYSSDRHDLIFHQPIRRWDEALPLGNGLTGCLIWGDGSPLRFSLDRGDLWDTRPAPEILAEDFTYRHLIELVRRGEQEAIKSRFNDFFTLYPYPTKLPAGRLELYCGAPSERMNSRLNMREAKAEVEWLSEGKTYKLASFLHAETRLGLIRLQGESLNHVNLQLVPPDYSGSYEEIEGLPSSLEISLASLGYSKAEKFSEGNLSWFHQKTKHHLEYAIVVGHSQRSKQDLEWVYWIAANCDGENWLEDAKEKVRGALKYTFDEHLLTHAAWWERYWLQSALRLPEPDIEKQWYLTNYLFGSCSRKGAPPMPLQGVWTADEGLLPPWKGDYHNDLNTQMSYWHYLKANHLQEGESFLDFLWDLRPAAREFAKSFFETEGINLPGVMTIDGKPLGGWPMYALSPTNQIWLCQAFDHYWIYTGNVEFLRTRTYVYMKETAECIQALLSTGENGKLQLPVSSSPEIHNDSLESWLTPNSNYDLALLRYLFDRLANMAELMGKHVDKQRWASILERLPELAVDDSGLMVCPDERLMETHRHFSHAMAIYPLLTIDYHSSQREKEIIDKTISHLERLGKGAWAGYTFPWMAALYTRQGNGEAARYHLQQFWDHTCSPNGFHLNGDYKNVGLLEWHQRPFTLEGNMAAADALQEMVLQTNKGVIRVFPAVPSDWLENGAEFLKLRGEMGVLVSAEVSSGELQYVELYAERSGLFEIENRFASDQLFVDTNGLASDSACPVGAVLSIQLLEGQSCRITSK